ncbi:hypothetical protein PR003_g16004 [Phytophthora rubi]|uniref:Uncharacterized protein n=1 Tax=Phytophthora rubi TaxID=129364 RepID=A0A6A4EUE3_9STRA|nr:hypothetical protein PR003_g16004 [Phytophthora rubi]
MVEVSIKAVAMDARAVLPSTVTPLPANLACSDVSSKYYYTVVGRGYEGQHE